MNQPRTIDHQRVEAAMREGRRLRSAYIAHLLGRLLPRRHPAATARSRGTAAAPPPAASPAELTISGLADAAGRVCFFRYRIGA